MIPYDIDPTLHSDEPEPQQLDDGFSAPQHVEPVEEEDAVLGDISPF